MLLADCRRGGVQIRHPVTVTGMQRLVVRESQEPEESRLADRPSATGVPPVPGIRALQDTDAGQAPRFEIRTTAGVLRARSLVIATGGLSIPAIGASDFAWQLATEWGLQTIAPRPASCR